MKLPRDLSGADLAWALQKDGDRVTRPGSDMRLTTSDGGEHHVTIPAPGTLCIGTLAEMPRSTHPYISTWAGFLYLAVVLDVWSRRVMGWGMASHLWTELVLAALEMPVLQRRPKEVIHHSDQDCPVHVDLARSALRAVGSAAVDGKRRRCLRQRDG